MTGAELFRFAAFISAVGLLYGLTLALLGRMALRRLAGRPMEASDRRAARGLLPPAALGLVCMAYGRFVEPFWPEVKRVAVSSPKLAELERPIRLVLLSDSHCDPEPRLEERIPGIVAGLKPDLIVFAGDAINSRGGLPVFRRMMSGLSAIAPTYAVRGNWDVWFWGGLDLFGGTGVVELGESPVAVRAAGGRLLLAGLPADEGYRARRVLERMPREAFLAFAHHYPDEIEGAAAAGADLYLAGHTHGGQVALPLYGALVTLSRFGKRFEAGLYLVGEAWLYVNRGLGMEGGRAPRVRFFARPEVTLIELHGRELVRNP